eukprot:PITA_25394
MVLKKKLKAIKMAKIDSATAYLTKITPVRDELAVIGEIIAPTELVRIALNGLPKTWENFVDGIVARENRIQNEIKKNHLGAAKQVEEDDNVALLARGKKGRAKKQASNSGGKGKGKGKQQNKEKDYSKVKCWNCQKLGHYVVVCLEKKNKKGKGKPMAASAEIESFSERFDQEFGFIACEATSARSPAIQVQRECAFPATSRASSSIWYVDSGATRHMTGVREYFSELLEGDTDMEVVLGDDNIVRAVGVGTLTFDRGPKPPLKVSDVLYVLGMKKNLIFVSALEDKGYDVLFKIGQVLIYPRGTPASSAREIGVRHAKVYKFSFQPLMALSSSSRDRTDSKSSSSELCEVWHRRMGHMYHGALSTLWEITTSVPDFNSDDLDESTSCLGECDSGGGFSGKKPDVGHFRIFGCLTYSYVPKENMTKLEPTVDKGIFVGYSETSKAYRIYILAQRKVVVRRDVKFEEERAFKRSREWYPKSPNPQE